MLSIAKYFVTNMNVMGNRPAREIEPPDATEGNLVTDISPEAAAGTSTAQCCTPQTLPQPPHILLGSPEWKVGTACCHTKKGAKTNSTRGAQGTTISDTTMPRWSQGMDCTSSTPLKKTLGCLQRLSWVGKVYRAQGCYQKQWRLEDTGVRAGSTPVPWETSTPPCPTLSPAWNTQAITDWISESWTHKRNTLSGQ